MKGFAYLLKLEADQNHNRYYRMVQEGDRFKIEMGRIGARPVCMVRPMTLWDTTYQKKIKEGYEDRSEFCDVSVEKNQNYKPIPDFVVAELMEYLQKEANQILEKSYTISWTDVNEHMLKDAQSLINQIGGSVEGCNQILLKLFVVIPRKMQNVQEMLAHTHKEIPEIIQREQDLLDVLRFKCKQNVQKGKTATPSETILDALGITIRECTYGENQQILKHLGKESQKYFKRAFRVQNIQTERRFYEWMSENGYTKKDIHCYFHGSKNQNYLGLLSEGPLLNPDAPITGKMFGYGIYLAPRAKKSINYTDISGSVWAKGKKHRAYLAVYKTASNMHYIKKIYVLLLTGSIVSITGCSAIQYGTEDLPKPTYQKSTEDTAKDIVKNKAKEEHQEFELSDEFVSKYLDMDSFEELKKRTQEGIAATSNESNMTKQEILLWRDMIKKKLAMQYTTDNYEQKKKELENSLDEMAEEHQMNRKDFYEKYYGMTEEDTEAFVKKQAEKLTESSDDVSEQAQGSEKQ